VSLRLMDGFNSATASLEKMMMELEPIELEPRGRPSGPSLMGMGHLRHQATCICNGVEEK
jgi:hypothetical protein